VVTLFSVVTPCRRIGRYRRFGETSSGLNMETVCLSEKLVSTYESTRRHNPEKTSLFVVFMTQKVHTNMQRVFES
jgi:hypothetical protein